MEELRNIFPTHITRGALLRSDGVAVGLVGGGAPSWELRSLAGRAQAGSDYHRLLLSLDAPIDVYMVDQPPNLASAVATLLDRQDAAEPPILATIRSELADYLAELSSQSGSRAKQTIWAVTAGGGAAARRPIGLDLGSLVKRRSSVLAAGPTREGAATLAQAVERARRLADSLAQLGGAPPPRLLEAEEIARLLYQLADPVRAQRYPLAGALLDRVRRIVLVE